MTPKPTGRVCVFCGKDEVTNEHVFAKWLRSVLGSGRALHMHAFWDVSGTMLHSRSHEGHPFNIEVSRVCQKRCNGGWMNDLENAARPFLEPMVLGRGRSLNRQDQTYLAAWAYKAALMLNFMLPEEGRAADPSEYRYLFAHKQPPPSAAIAVGAYSGEEHASFRGHPLHLGPQVRGRKGRGPFNGYTMTFTVGQVAFHVFHSTLPNQSLSYGGGDIPRLIQWLWPIQQDLLLWTPRPAFDQATLLDFADALGRP
jgi:hypothetical protein